MNNTQTSILLSAGGTGGHMMPAIALAQDLRSRGYKVDIVTDPRCQHYKTLYPDLSFHVIAAGTLGKGFLKKVTGGMNLMRGMIQARALVKRLKPSVVVGFGGYPSYAPVAAAQAQKIPTIIHESNAILGKANKMLAPKAARIALSWPLHERAGLEEGDRIRAIETGNPVREEIANLFTKPYPPLSADGDMVVLIMGGSLGASVFSKVVPQAFALLPEAYRKRVKIVQQCREEDLHDVRTAYQDAGIEAKLESFFTNVPELLSECHLFIGRSGATTVTEMAVAGRPAVFVPAGYHADNQQRHNAEAIAEAGGAWVMEETAFTPEALLPRLETFLQHPEALFDAAEAARGCGKPDAARKLGNLVMAMVSGWK